MKHPWMTFLLPIVLIACSGISLFRPYPTATPTATTFPSNTPKPKVTSTPDYVAEYLPLLPEIPAGFSWRIVPELKLAVLIPDGWFFKQEISSVAGIIGAVYVSQENIDELGRFSTGQTVFVYQPDSPEAFAANVLTGLENADTTTKVIKSWDYQADTYVVHHLRVEASFPDEANPDNRKKTVQYSTLVKGEWVYLIVVESPTSIWEQVSTDYGILLDYVVIFPE